jgi:hypothetical protein
MPGMDSPHPKARVHRGRCGREAGESVLLGHRGDCERRERAAGATRRRGGAAAERTHSARLLATAQQGSSAVRTLWQSRHTGRYTAQTGSRYAGTPPSGTRIVSSTPGRRRSRSQSRRGMRHRGLWGEVSHASSPTAVSGCPRVPSHHHVTAMRPAGALTCAVVKRRWMPRATPRMSCVGSSVRPPRRPDDRSYATGRPVRRHPGGRPSSSASLASMSS